MFYIHISIYQVLLQKKIFKEHINRIKKADLQYPLIIINDKYDKHGGILDGNHRFAKIIMENKKYVNCIRVSQKELDKIKVKV